MSRAGVAGSWLYKFDPNFAPRTQLRSLPLVGEGWGEGWLRKRRVGIRRERSALIDWESHRVHPSP
ncbi:hypothetical protein BwDG23_78290 [Bradyrhizobium ottawaense]|nr:hypothetical protein BwSG10_78290 [Bradyrhizobium ottawaense]GMP13996.1 hypothetical protein BwDG23_78290 [Bradyrhizobium ottawaense]